MDTFDYVIVSLGVALVIIGLVLFIAGKRDSANGNQVEGFGIKLNVSNPSIILIVFGIGLVLFPRFMPSDKTLPTITTTESAVAPASSTNQQSSSTVEPVVQQNHTNADNEQVIGVPAPSSNVFFPQGLWYLYQYEENGIDLSSNIEGTMQFYNSNGSQQSWSANLMAIDVWGNAINYQYAGIIRSAPGGYLIDTQRSNDPTFVPQGASNLILQMDNPQSLHLEYVFNGSQIILHLTQ